jgi:hypothetical protein
MRRIAIIVVVTLGWGCGSGENAGAEEAKRQAEREAKEKVPAEAAKTISPPVPGRAKIPCEQLIDVPAFQAALGEKDPISIKELKNESEAAASCAIVRGGKRPTDAEQQSMIKSGGKLGVLNGDEICEVAAFCWTFNTLDLLQKRCKETKRSDDDTMGNYACVRIVATGEADVKLYQFYDEDTKCVIQVRGGASQTDNGTILTCAKTARDKIGPDQIAVKK